MWPNPQFPADLVIFTEEILTENFSFCDSNEIRAYNHLVRKRTLNHLAILTKWLSCVVNTYLYVVFDCMLLSCHVRISEWIHTL